MNVSYTLHFLLAGASILFGVGFGALYDLFRVMHALHPRAKVLIFFEDILYCLLCSIGFSLLFFNLSYGRMRLYAFVLAGVGFFLWHKTVGRLFFAILQKTICIVSAPYITFRNKMHMASERFRLYRRASKGFPDRMSRK